MRTLGTAMSNTPLPKNNWGATVAPTVTADAAAGYDIGSIWVDTAADKAYLCTDATSGAALWRGIDQAQAAPSLPYLAATAVWNPASVANGANAAPVTVAVAGAVVGRPVEVGFSGITAAGWRLTGNVISAGQVSVLLTNNTGGAVDLPSGTLTVVVLNP